VTTNDIIENRKIIANENFDILVYAEIGLCAKSRYTAFSRLAPIQINTWGHSDTSGLPNIDYFVSSKYFNSPEDQEYYSEKLVLFNSLGTYYHDIFKTLDISFNNRIDFCKNVSIATGIDNPTIYGCLQLHFKIHPTFISILNQILMMDKKGVIVILAPLVDTDAEKDFKNNINEQIKYNKRLYFINEMPFNNFIETALCCHVILDYYPFGGFNTTIEMLLNGKICITMPGNLINGKFTKGLYEKMNITEFICTTENEYVTKAVKYGKNILKRKEYENLILKNVHKIIEDEESVQEWKTFLKTIIASHRNK
jgi:predicted O-linked N-acetylglucosamine transferase (SPINDLY family)